MLLRRRRRALAPPPASPAAKGHGGDAHTDNYRNNDNTPSLLADITSSRLLDLLGRIPVLFEQMVIPASSAGPGAAPFAPPPQPPAAEGHGGGAEDDDDGNTLLDLVERFPDLFAQKVLQHLDPIDRTFLAQAAGACRAAVAASDLPRAGTREEVLGMNVWGWCRTESVSFAPPWSGWLGPRQAAARGLRGSVRMPLGPDVWRRCGSSESMS